MKKIIFICYPIFVAFVTFVVNQKVRHSKSASPDFPQKTLKHQIEVA
jgi:hypothetical protein